MYPTTVMPNELSTLYCTAMSMSNGHVILPVVLFFIILLGNMENSSPLEGFKNSLDSVAAASFLNWGW